MEKDFNSQLFLSLIYSFQMQAMMQMGKLKNPLTEKTEKELDAAKVTIDMLDMMKEKTIGNLSEDESKFLDQVISDLKINYVEEKGKDDSSAKFQEPAASGEKTEEVKSEDKENTSQ